MSRRVIAVVVGTLLGLVATSLWVPALVQDDGMAWDAWDTEWTWLFSVVRDGGHELQEHRQGETTDSGVRAIIDVKWRTQRRLHWPLLVAQQSLVLLLGGGLLTFVVRRKRRVAAVRLTTEGE